MPKLNTIEKAAYAKVMQENGKAEARARYVAEGKKAARIKAIRKSYADKKVAQIKAEIKAKAIAKHYANKGRTVAVSEQVAG